MPGRYAAVIEMPGDVDEDAIVGYDEPMQTHFLHSGCEDKHDGSPLISMGTEFREFPTMASLVAHMAYYSLELLELEFEPWPPHR